MNARKILRWTTALVLLLAVVFGPASAAVRAPCAQATSASAVIVASADAGAHAQTPAAALAPACNAHASVTVAVTTRRAAAATRECCAWGDVAVPASVPTDTPSRPPSLV